jgi:hypothetical protein
VLLALFEHTDADALLVLLEPVNLLALLRQDGWSDEAVRTALEVEKKLPGELVLGLFQRGRTTDELLAALGPAAVAEVAAERAKSAAKAAAKAAGKSPPPDAPGSDGPATAGATSADVPPPLARLGVGSARVQTAGLVLVLASALAPAMLALFDLKIALALLRFGVAPVLALIALGGAIGGVIAAGPAARRWVLALGGAVASAGSFVAVVAYALLNASAGRSSLLRLEIAAICMIGMLPGVALAALLNRVTNKRA